MQNETSTSASAALFTQRGRILAIWVFTAAVNLLMLNGALYMVQVYDRVLGSRSLATLVTLTALMVFLFAVMAAIDIIRQRLLVVSAGLFAARLRGAAHRAAIGAARRGLARDHALNDLETVRSFVAGAGPSAMLDLPWAPLFVALAFAIHPGIGASVLAGGVVMVVLTLASSRLAQGPARRAGEARARARFILEAERRQAGNVLAMGMAGNLHRRHDRAAAAADARAAHAIGGAAAIARVVRLALQSLILGLGALFVIRGELSAGAMLADYLGAAGLSVRLAADGADLDRLLREAPTRVLVLDVNMPGEDGLSVARRRRARGERAGIVMLTARGEEESRLSGLSGGADDYIVKPFALSELLARIRAVARRLPEVAAGPITLAFGAARLDPAARRLIAADGTVSELSAPDHALIEAFLRNPHRTLSRERLSEIAHGRALEPGERSIDIRITRLRRRIEPDPGRPRVIVTLRGEGYVYRPGG